MMADEPACWSWAIPTVRNREEEIAFRLLDQERRPEGERYSRAGWELILEDVDDGRLTLFHENRCALCGVAGLRMVQDHCHATGQVRGLLCQGCNTREGQSNAPVVIRYRRIHPAAILDVHVLYTGRDWEAGWFLGDGGYREGERPATPWPVWSKDDPIGVRRVER